MKEWWQKRSRRVWLSLYLTVACDTVLALCIFAAHVAGILKFTDRHETLPILTTAGGVVTLLVFWIGYLFAGHALEPVRQTVELARRLSTRPDQRQIPLTNPHDDIGELEIFLNGLLQRLQGSFVELDRLAADASHELRTPLTAMRTVGEVALREKNPAILYDAVGSMLEEIRRMNQLIDRLLLLTRVDSEKWPVRPKPGLVRNILIEVSDTLTMVAEDKQQRLRVDCADNLRATFDPALLRLALMNLTQNAIRYSQPDKLITLRGATESNWIIVEVVDQGPGIAEEHRKKLFDRFYRVDEARSRAEGGIGLGLAIVKWAVERTGGSVELESEVGKGSVFRVRLPLANN
jgi:signal transduction histidine kinase